MVGVIPGGAIFLEGTSKSDRLGQFDSTGSAQYFGEPEQDFKHQTVEHFSKELVEYLEKSRLENQFDQLTTPLFLGELHKALAPSLSQMVKLELDKDKTKLKPEDIRQDL